MAKRFKYEQPALIDMMMGSVEGVADCNAGNWQSSCTGGSCVSVAYCQYGNWTGWCESGTQACGNSGSCYVCCADGALVGSMGTAKGMLYACSCSSGSNAGAVCTSGTRTSFVCETGSSDVPECEAY